jgi:hypothetical protein
MARLKDEGVRTELLPRQGIPFGDEVEAFIDRHERVFVVEQNRDAQLRSLLILTSRSTPGSRPILHYNGLPLLRRREGPRAPGEGPRRIDGAGLSYFRIVDRRLVTTVSARKGPGGAA